MKILRKIVKWEFLCYYEYMALFQKYILLLVVFITGACILVLELTATRVLTPFYGNTLYTISSVLTIILFALSTGYFFGGRLADKHPSLFVFYSLIFFGGVSVFVLYFLDVFLLPKIAFGWSFYISILLSSLLLFLPPNFLLAMLSPFVIKLEGLGQTTGKIGEISGSVYFWSTFGSIFGSLLSGFYLIPTFGIDAIVIGVGVVLLIIGLLGIFLGKWEKDIQKQAVFVLLVLITIPAIIWSFKVQKDSTKNYLYSQYGTYQKISIYNSVYNGKQIRVFQQDRNLSGAMYLNSSEQVYPYTKYHALYKLLNPNIHHVLVLGGAPYTVPKALLATEPNAQIDVAEIEPRMLELGKKYFRVPTTARLVNHVADARRFVHDSQKTYDLIFGDAFSSIATVPSHLTTVEFYELVKSRLSANGVYVQNMGGTLTIGPPSFLFSVMKTFRSVFPNSYFFAVVSPAQTAPQNVMFVAKNSNISFDFSSENLKYQKDPFLKSLPEHIINVDRFDLSPYPILTDNYAPTDFLALSLELSILSPRKYTFNASDAWWLIHQQVGFGQRVVGSVGNIKEQTFLQAELSSLNTDVQTLTVPIVQDGKSYQIRHFLTSLYPDKEKRILLLTHYSKDTSSTVSVDDANSLASGVAVLLQILQYLKDVPNAPKVGVDFLFADAKPIGDSYLVQNLDSFYPTVKPKVAIVVENVCAKNSYFYQEQSQFAQKEMSDFWNIANQNGYSTFVTQTKNQTNGVHNGLNAVGIPSFEIYGSDASQSSPDTINICSKDTLSQVGNAILKYIYSL